MWALNPTWGNPRIRDELAKLGLTGSTATLRKYRPKSRGKPSQSWRTFLQNHKSGIVAMDFFVVPTATFRRLYVLVVLNHERRKIVHFNITASPTAAWSAQQIVTAFPYDTAPKYLLRDRDSIYGSVFVERVQGMGIQEKLIAPRSPWQNPFVERLIGSIRRECLDRVIVFHERQLKKVLESCWEYYHEVRPHRSLSHDSPIPRPVEFRVLFRSPESVPRLPSPEHPKSRSLPADEGFGLEDHQRVSPIEPNCLEEHPKITVRPAEFGPARLPFEHHELMAQRQNFQGEIVPRAKERKRIRQNDPKNGQHDPLSFKVNSLQSTIS